METPDVTKVDYAAGGLFAVVAAGCLSQGVTGDDLIAYLVGAALVSVGAMVSDAIRRHGRAGVEAARVDSVTQQFVARTNRAGAAVDRLLGDVASMDALPDDAPEA